MNAHNSPIRHLWKVLSAVMLTALAACSDGGGVIEQPKPDIVAPIINSFKVTKAGDSATSGAAITVNAGEGVEIAWSVSGADKVELKSESGTLALHEVAKTDGTEAVANIQADETFVLTAYNQGLSVQDAVRVSVARKVELKVLKFEPTAATIEPGQSTTLCYEVQPAEAEVHIYDAAGIEIPPAGFEPPLLEEEGPLTETPPDEELLVDGIAVSIASKSLNLPPPGLRASTVSPGETPAAPETTPAPDAPEAPILPAVTKIGCTVEVMPAATMEYSLEATLKDADGAEQTVEQKATVTVASSLSIESFVAKDAAGNEITAPLTATGKVTLEWVVKPADAQVAIDQGVGDVTAATVDGKGSKEVEVAATTTYTLTASKEGSAAQTKQVTVTVEIPQITTVVLQPSATHIFAGEEVTLTATVYDAMGGGPFPSLVVRAPDGQEIQGEGNVVKVKPMQSGSYQAIRVGDAPVTSNPVQITVRTWGHAHGGSTMWASVGVHPTDPDYVLTGSVGDLDGIQVGWHHATEDWAVAPVDYRTLFASLAFPSVGGDPKKVNIEKLATFAPFPINGFAFDAQKDEGKRVYVAMAGALLYSKDGGVKFGIAEVFPVIDAKAKFRNKPESHMSCDGFTQQGMDSSETDFVGIQQVCDVIVDRDAEGSVERLFVATDYGVYYVDDIDRLMKDRSKVENGWRGLPRAGEKMNPAANIFGVVAHDIELVRASGSAMLVAGTQHGVYVSAARGEKDSWQPLNGGALGSYDLTTRQGDAKAVYAVAVDAAAGKIYAGTADGVYERSLNLISGEWKQIQSTVSAVEQTPEPLPAQPEDETVAATGKAAGAAPADAGAASTAAGCAGCVYSLAVGPDGSVLAGTGSGVFLSRDKGATFIDVSASMGANMPVYGVTVKDAGDGDLHYLAATERGVFISHGEHAAGETPHDPMPMEEPQPQPQPAVVSATVKAVAGKFEPAVVEAEAGATLQITFVNEDTVQHSLTAEDLSAVGAGNVDLVADPGGSAVAEFAVTTAGESTFRCKFHPEMTGTIKVQAPASH